MYVARIVGTLVCTRKVPELDGFKLLVVKKTDLAGKAGSEAAIAVDCVGSGVGEHVLVVTGSSARMTKQTDQKPVDAAVVGVVDTITLAVPEGQAAERPRAQG